MVTYHLPIHLDVDVLKSVKQKPCKQLKKTKHKILLSTHFRPPPCTLPSRVSQVLYPDAPLHSSKRPLSLFLLTTKCFHPTRLWYSQEDGLLVTQRTCQTSIWFTSRIEPKTSWHQTSNRTMYKCFHVHIRLYSSKEISQLNHILIIVYYYYLGYEYITLWLNTTTSGGTLWNPKPSDHHPRGQVFVGIIS